MATLTLGHYSLDESTKLFHLATPQGYFGTRSPALNTGDPTKKMEEIRNYVHNTMNIYEKVFESVATEEAFFVQPIHKLRHPLIFYYGHTACFYIGKLCAAGIVKRINPKLEEMVAVGVDEMSWDDLNEEHYDWPSVNQVAEYRRTVRSVIDEMLTSGKYKLILPLTFENSTANLDNAFWWAILMSAEHERIHIETASVHVRELPIKYVKPSMSLFWKRCDEVSPSAPINELIEVPGGKVHLGRRPDSELYGWDCDYSDGNYVIDVSSFKASKYLVSNAEFFAFIKADGYNTQRYWDEEGWNWVQWKKPLHPWFWVRDESRPDGYALRLQTELIDLPWNWPCELNNLEAHAFCQFKGEQLGKSIRMPTEAEWMLLWDLYVGKDLTAWGVAPGNLNFEHYNSSCPVNKFSHGPFFDVVGNVWQHCETRIYPYPGFSVHPLYDDYSMPTFDGRHACMKGGTWVSSGSDITRDARFAFRRHFFQCVGLRYVEGEPVNEMRYCQNVLGLDPEVDALTDANFRESFKGIPNGCLKIAEYAMEQFKTYAKIEPQSALDFACGAGRISYELTKLFPVVVGGDFTARRLVFAYAMKERGMGTYSVFSSSEQERMECVIRSSNYSWDATRENARFFQADPTNLHSHMKDFSLILCWNTLDSYDPTAIPAHLLGRLNPGGLLVIGSRFASTDIDTSEEDPQDGDSLQYEGLTEEEVFRLLGGDEAVERVGEPLEVKVVFPSSDCVAKLKRVQLATYRKK